MARAPTRAARQRRSPERLQALVAERLAQLRVAADLTQEELAARLGIATRNVQHVEAGRQNLTLQTIEKFANALQVDPVAAVAVVRGRRRHTPPDLHVVADIADGRPPHPVPIVTLEIAAGYARTGRIPTAIGWTLLPDQLGGRAFVAQVIGQSMEPLIPERSWSLFRATDTLSVGRIGLFEVQARSDADVDRSYVVKRLAERTSRRATLKSMNPAFAPVHLDEQTGSVRIVAEWLRVVSRAS